jgi:hypothetical protein
VAKLEKKLKMVDLQLKKERLDQTVTPVPVAVTVKPPEDESAESKPTPEPEPVPSVIVTDRNSLIEQLKQQINTK